MLPPSVLRAFVEAAPFPDAADATQEGLLAYGGDLAPERLIAAYAQGVFPWYDADPILWFTPDPRVVIRPEALRVNRTLRKNLRRRRFRVELDTAFREVIEACADAERPEQDGTWINPDMIEAYCELHRLGFAHSVEAWRGGALVGGVYGVSLGRAFFGESMFARESDASKVAFVHLIRQIQAWDFAFLDCQAPTEHTERLGAEAWPRERFLAELAAALEHPTRLGAWRFDRDWSPDVR